MSSESSIVLSPCTLTTKFFLARNDNIVVLPTPVSPMTKIALSCFLSIGIAVMPESISLFNLWRLSCLSYDCILENFYKFSKKFSGLKCNHLLISGIKLIFLIKIIKMIIIIIVKKYQKRIILGLKLQNYLSLWYFFLDFSSKSLFFFYFQFYSLSIIFKVKGSEIFMIDDFFFNASLIF